MDAGIKRARGRPPTPPADAAGRKARWDHAVSFSGLRQSEIAVLVGRSASRVAHYGSTRGAVPPEDAIAALEAFCQARVEREAGRLGVNRHAILTP
jgi:hypothetical protein